MPTESPCAAGDCPTFGADATPLDHFDDIETGSGDWFVYDRGTEDAWVRSDLYLARESCV
jgi:hypothetical protein